MKVISGGKDGKNGELAKDVLELRALLADIQERDRAVKIATAELHQRMAEFNLKLTRAAASRRVVEGFGLDLNDGKIKPNSEVKPYTG